MIASEAAYFDKNHCQHVAAYHDHLREKRRIRQLADAQWRRFEGRSIQRIVQDDLAALRSDTAWLAKVEADWLA